jgi:hypothetical protein
MVHSFGAFEVTNIFEMWIRGEVLEAKQLFEPMQEREASRAGGEWGMRLTGEQRRKVTPEDATPILVH